jgi:hypothetical protein
MRTPFNRALSRLRLRSAAGCARAGDSHRTSRQRTLPLSAARRLT